MLMQAIMLFQVEELASFETLLDFYRFGCSSAKAQGLYYGHGTETLEDDIMALILGSLNLAYDSPFVLLNARLTANEKKLLSSQLKKRIVDRVPVPYLTKEAMFYGQSFYVDERVLIPRSPIQELIQQHFAPWIIPEQVSSILDICTGSGCIAIACCLAFPEAEVDALDISADALAVAEINRERHGVLDQLVFYQSDGFNDLPVKQYDLIVSNPPYVGEVEWKNLPQEYTHEPRLALYADEDGLKIVNHILEYAKDYLTDQGVLVVEVGNTRELLMATYPDVPFVWLDFEHGGDGIFLLTALDLRTYF